MPDGHSGYGFPIGGVAAMDVDFGGFALSIQKEMEGRCRLQGSRQGEPIDPGRHQLRVEIKAVTMHRLAVTPGPDGWKFLGRTK